ncbi:PAS domain S-box protein [candidate division KSB1 bacterium]|nr:PAS domain S-box protein [candidate division KSB1 bacterium]
MQTAGVLIIVSNVKGEIKRFNRACELLTGYTVNRVIGRTIAELPFLSEEAKKVHLKQCRDILNGPANSRFENCWIAPNGSCRYITWSSTYLKDLFGRIEWIIWSGIDITDRKQIESSLDAEHERLSVTLSSITEGVISTDLDGSIVLINRVASRLTGWSHNAVSGKSINEILRLEDEETRQRIVLPISSLLLTDNVIDHLNDAILVSRDNTERLVSYSINPLKNPSGIVEGAVVVLRDITERRKTEIEMHKMNKLDSIGMLAGGIAHDFNNILTSIIGYISLLRNSFRDNNTVLNRLDQIATASSRANQLTQKLLTFSRGGKPIKTSVYVKNLLKETIEYLAIELKASIELNLGPDLWNLYADSSQINQVIQNLIINADQAMPTGGVIKINAENISVKTYNPYTLVPGNYVKIEVSDQGVGIKKEHINSIFDPYFTTKENGRGFGLAICYSIIKKHQGTITVDSIIGSGTTFTLIIPATRHEVEKRTVSIIQSDQIKGKVLVMDDDDLVREIIGEMLGEIGFECEFARDGHEVINLFQHARDEKAPFDLLIIDLIVKDGMNGKETISKLCEIDPDVKAIVSSGYSTDSILAEYRQYGFKGIVVKPYSIEDLYAVISNVLNRDPV